MRDIQEGRIDGLTLADYVRVVWRRKLIVVGCCLFALAAATLLARHSHHGYRASADVLFNRTGLPASFSSTGSLNTQQAARIAQTQAHLALSPALVARVLASAHVRGLTTQQFLRKSTVAASPSADILTFTVKNRDSAVATRLVNAYAQQFVLYRRSLAEAPSMAALATLRARMADLERRRAIFTPLYAQLATRYEDLATANALDSGSFVVSRPATAATKIASRQKQYAIIGIGAGLVLGLILAFLADALDTSVRSEAQISQALRLPLLVRLAAARQRWSKRALTGLRQSPRGDASGYRTLREELDFVLVRREIVSGANRKDAKTVLVAGAKGGDGSLLVAAELAVFYARAHRRVILVDLSGEDRVLRRLFGLEFEVGVDEVVSDASLDDALKSVEFPGSANGSAPGGTMRVLPRLGRPGEEPISGRALDELLARMQERSDIIVAAAPPLLETPSVGLVQLFDLSVLALRPAELKEQDLQELATFVDRCETKPVGFVVMGNGRRRTAMTGSGRSTRRRLVAGDGEEATEAEDPVATRSRFARARLGVTSR